MGAISESFRESAGKGVAKVSGSTRSSREHDRSLRARPGLLSRFSGDRKYPVSLGHSSDDRSLHSERHSAVATPAANRSKSMRLLRVMRSILGFFILSIVSSGGSDSGNEFPSVPAKPHFFAACSSQLLIEAGRVRIPCWGLPFHRRALKRVRLLCNHLHHFSPSATVAVRRVKI